MFLINVVYSGGLFNGRESVPYIGEKDVIIDKVFERYRKDYADAEKWDATESPKLSKEKFSEIMNLGFYTNEDFVLIQGYDYHIQYEPSMIEPMVK